MKDGVFYSVSRTVPGYAGVRGSAINNATVTVNGNSAWRLGEYFYGGDDAENSASAVMKELDITAVVNPSGTNEADRVQSVTGKVFVAKSPEAFTYDDDGNMLSDGRFTYTWDGENRLVSIETSEAAASAGAPHARVEYTYDNRSRRIGKVISHFENDTWTVAESRAFVYDGWNMVQEFSTFNTQLSILNSYVWGLDLSGSLQGAGGVGGLLAVISPLPLGEGQGEGSTAYLPCYDGNGNVCEYSSTDGSIAAHYEYSPFGETVIQFGDLADAFSFRFSTKYWEKEAGLYYYGYRFYVPDVGRWLNRDPMEEDGGVNLYGHVRNSSINQIDSLGLKCTINVLFGHGATEDVPGNWLLSESFRLFPELDDDDRIALLGCVSTQVSILLFQKLYKEAGSTEEALENTLKLMRQKFINSGVDYTVNNVDTMGPAWNKLAISVVAETRALCDNGCCDVFIKWTAQEGDKQIDKIKAFLLRMHAKMLKDSEAGYKTVHPFLGAKEPGAEDFFGKTFRWSCEHKYFEVLK